MKFLSRGEAGLRHEGAARRRKKIKASGSERLLFERRHASAKLQRIRPEAAACEAAAYR
jgi:hypothetical protein